MGKTLFSYIFGQLLRVFAQAVLALTGMMCFGGLLRPLTENGLTFGQVNLTLLYLMPAMFAYSLPVAALFAATAVYGRMSADNEWTAMRAAGIGYFSPIRFSAALPALILGLLVALTSLLLLCFVVPIFMFKVEQVVYSNIARVIASRIEREHEVSFPHGGMIAPVDIFAQSATVDPPDPNHPENQGVQLVGATIVSYEYPDPSHTEFRVPKEFWMASTAAVVIHGSSANASAAAAPATLTVRLVDGTEFPRSLIGNSLAGVAQTTFGPIEIPSPIDENVKFMGIGKLDELIDNPGLGQHVQEVVRDYTRDQQETEFFREIANQLNAPAGPLGASYRFQTTETDQGPANEVFEIGADHPTTLLREGELIVTDTQSTGNDGRNVWLRQWDGTQMALSARAKEIHIKAVAYPAGWNMSVSLLLTDTELTEAGNPSTGLSFSRSFATPMPPAVAALNQKTLDQFLNDPSIDATARANLVHEEMVITNSAWSELHSRASFALSCLVLVMVGAALGVMSRSGNLLNSFAVSAAPAILCITLIFCGQRAATHVPFGLAAALHNPLNVGLVFIWAGNAVVLTAAIWLTVRLLRQ